MIVTDFSAPMRAKVFKFCIHLLRVEVYCVKENNNAEIYFAFFFPFFHISLHVKDFSGTTACRILKFGTNIGFSYLFHVRQNQRPHVYHSLYLSIFLFPPCFLSRISQELLHLGF